MADSHQGVRDPELICASANDPDVHLYYRGISKGFVCVVVGGDEPTKRFVITAYFTKATKTRTSPVDKVRVYYDQTGNTLTVWFDDPKKESFCEEIDDDVVLMKDRRGRVIGFERLNFRSRKQQAGGGRVPIEVQMM